MDFSEIRGFNYQPSYGSTSLENWLYFDSTVFELELRRGKHHFPKMNTIRLWLSWDAYIRKPQAFQESFEKALRIADDLELAVVPTLFNRWHNWFCDCGGVYLDHIVPGYGWPQKENMFQPYMEDIVGDHAADPRILIWDLCNEPFSYRRPLAEMKEVEEAEYAWLESLFKTCKRLQATAPIGVSLHNGHGGPGLERVSPISDVLLIHPYYWDEQDDAEAKSRYFQLLDDYAAVGQKTGKPLLVTETCWGSLDDAWRAENIRFTLGELKKRHIGWIVHALHHSLVADLHRPEYGPVGEPGNLAFIEADGSLRPGHDVFNDF